MARRPQPWFRNGRGWYLQRDGRQVFLGRNKKAAFQQYHKLMSQPTQPVGPPNCEQPFVVVCDDFLDWNQRNRSPRTYAWYRERLQSFVNHLRNAAPGISVHDIKPLHIDGWVAAHPNWSPTTQRVSIIAVQRCYTWATKMGHVARNPVGCLDKPAAVPRNRCLAKSDYDSLLAAVTDDKFRDLLTLAWETGARPQELFRVEARHVDRDLHRWVFPPAEAKGKRRPRIVYLTDEAFAVTERLVKLNADGPLLRNRHGKPWTAFAANCRFTRLAAKLGERICLYSFRHSFATRMLASGLDALTVALLLGHSNPSILATTYQHLAHRPDFLRKQLAAAKG